jgi:hypothetical protein
MPVLYCTQHFNELKRKSVFGLIMEKIGIVSSLIKEYAYVKLETENSYILTIDNGF